MQHTSTPVDSRRTCAALSCALFSRPMIDEMIMLLDDENDADDDDAADAADDDE